LTVAEQRKVDEYQIRDLFSCDTALPGARTTQENGKMFEKPLVSIVDDDVWARAGISELVQSLGYRASTFESGRDFLESGCVEGSTCVITDLQMPEMSGLELQRQLRVLGYSVPIIFITAFPSEAHRAQALNAGAIGFLTKPFDERSLIECLSLAISTSRP
jgi:FixJ family two-component response regulator